MADAESQLKRLARNMKKAQTERKDAAAAYYDIGVRIAEERIAELDLAIEHFSKWVASQNRKNPTYALIHRPVGQFHVPAGYKEFGTHPDFKFGTVTYDAPLPPAEIEHWSLIDVSRSNEDIAREIADGLMEYANEQIEDAQDDPRGFAVGVGQYIDRMRVHADRAVIAPLVLEVLRARAVRENPRTNRYAAACHACGARVAEGAGTLEGPPWRTFCAACLPQTAAQAPAPRRADSRILATLGPRNTVEFRLEGHAGGAFQDYRRACAPCKAVKEGDAWVNRISMADAGPVLEAMAAISGLQLVVDDEVMGALKGRVVDVGGRLDAAKTRLEAVEGQLAARGHELYPFQRHGVEWLATQDAAILADDMGLGKTGQALVAAPQNAPILVIGPAVAKGVWIREAAKWRPDLHPILLSGRTSFRWPKPSEMVVTNYDILADQLLAAPQGVVVIADEAHALKNNKAKRTQRFRLVADAAREAGGVVWLLTATPLLGKPPELWALLQAIDRIPFSGFSEFGRLMGGEKVYDRGAKREIWEWDGTPDPEAAERLKLVMLRRMKTEVLTELPPKRYQTIEVELEKGVQRKLTAALKKWDAVARPDELPPFEQMSAARADLAAAKIPAMLELVEEFEEAGEPVVVFSAHRAPIDILDERPGWAIITGDTPPDVRSQIEEAFQRGELKGIGATIQAGGIAITLTRASNAVFVDLDWTPALNAQAEDRIYRIGQDRGVLITRLVADHEMDRRLLEVLSEKQNRIDASVDAARRGGDESLVSADEAERLDRLADTLARKMAGMSEELAEILEAQEDYRARVAHLDQQARDRAEREIQERWQREIRERAERRGLDIAEADDTDMHSPATPTQKWAAEALMTLTELDTDRARDENAMGFNKADTRVGQALAMRAATGGLTDLEWRFAIAMLRKYWRQVGRAPEANPPQSSIMLSAHPETERAYEDWLILADGSDIVFPLEKEGYGWVYLAPAGVPELEVEHVLITDEFPLATIVVAKKMLNPRLVGEHGMLIVGPDSQREYRVRAIMDFYREHPGPIVLTNHQRNDWAALVHPATRIGVGWQGSMFDKDGPFSHVESGTAEGAVRELVGEWGFRVPDPDAMERVLGKRANLC
jgi:SWI/SNF-related matrix-associated actin-dependent regulator 1 of chromatin subfamily A